MGYDRYGASRVDLRVFGAKEEVEIGGWGTFRVAFYCVSWFLQHSCSSAFARDLGCGSNSKWGLAFRSKCGSRRGSA